MLVNADDFGLHPAVNEAIERACQVGLVTATSFMALGAACDDAARRARDLPGLDVGLHFTLVGVPGYPPTLGAFLRAYWGGQFSARRLGGELRRQLDTALRVHRLPLSHIDSHQHLHALPGVMRMVCRVAAEYDIPGIRLPLDGPSFAPISPGRRAQTAALRAACRLSRRYIDAYGRRTTDHFSGMAVSGHLTRQTLAAFLAHARNGTTEIVCHPGADDRALGHLYDWGYHWEDELYAVCLPRAEARITPITWRSM